MQSYCLVSNHPGSAPLASTGQKRPDDCCFVDTSQSAINLQPNNLLPEANSDLQAQAIFFTPAVLSTQDAFKWMGVMAIGIALFQVRLIVLLARLKGTSIAFLEIVKSISIREILLTNGVVFVGSIRICF